MSFNCPQIILIISSSSSFACLATRMLPPHDDDLRAIKISLNSGKTKKKKEKLRLRYQTRCKSAESAATLIATPDLRLSNLSWWCGPVLLVVKEWMWTPHCGVYYQHTAVISLHLTMFHRRPDKISCSAKCKIRAIIHPLLPPLPNVCDPL